MKTSGELLREARLKKNKSIGEIASEVKVKPEYLEALEKNKFEDLPSATFTKGFLRKYASVLGVNPDTVGAMFRRDFAEDDSGRFIPKSLVQPVSRKPTIHYSFLIGAFAILSFLGFLGFQLYSYLSLPKIELIQPVSGETYAGVVSVKGKTAPDNTVTINNQPVIVSPNGEFTLELTFTSGTHSVVVQATNRIGKSRLVQRSFQIVR